MKLSLISKFRFIDKLRKEHKQVFPEIGDINVSALKVKRRRKFYRFSESRNVYKAFDGISRNWFMHVDAGKVEKGEVLTIMAADEKRSNLELVEKKKIAIGSVLVEPVGLVVRLNEDGPSSSDFFLFFSVEGLVVKPVLASN